MNKKKLLATLLLLGGTLLAHSQIDLSGMGPSSIDSLQKNRIRYFSPGSGGKKKVWNFSHKLDSRETTQVTFRKDSTGVLSITENGKAFYYSNSSDTLVLSFNESPLESKSYPNGKLIRALPVRYGYSVNRPFLCDGMYCGNHPFREVGSTSVNVDAEGCLILAEYDTIYNVKRVHTIDSYSKCMDIKASALDTAKLTQVIDERYEWYLPGSQYPIIENVTSTTYLNMDAIGTTKYAFCNLPSDLAALYIVENAEIEYGEEDNSFETEGVEPDIIHYKIDTNGSIVNITYDLDADATISTIITSHMGMTHSYREWSQKVGEGFHVQIDCSSLRPGIYILYINVNGKIYSEKITL